MAQFTEIVPGRLWQVQDLLPAAQVDDICSTDWHSLPWTRTTGQELWPRRQVDWSCSRAGQLSAYINHALPEINQATGSQFKQASGVFWIDQPGFTCALHTDGHLPAAMQIYWTVPGVEWGTGFYHFKDPAALLYQFASVPNSGYVMLNHANPDGSQPLQWHGMLNPVPADTIRVTSYWQFH
jgi:hypothetical protein